MAVREITFAPDKALESVLYIAARLAEPTIHEVLKIRYFADKLHLAQYGFLASGDDYVAMRFGPVASGTYNLLKAARGDQSGPIHPMFAELVRDSLAVKPDHKSLVTLRAADLGRLSVAQTRRHRMPRSDHRAIRQHGIRRTHRTQPRCRMARSLGCRH